MSHIFLLIFIFIFIVIFLNFKLGIKLTLIFILFVPTQVKHNLGGVSLPLSAILSLFLFMKLALQRLNQLEIKQYCKCYMIWLLFILIFFLGSELDFFTQLYSFITFPVLSVLFPFIAWFVLTDSKSITEFNNILIVSTTIICLYGIYCSLTVSNPYLSFIDSVFPSSVPIEVRILSARNLLQTRISSTFQNTINYAGFLLLIFFYFLTLHQKERSTSLLLCLSLIVINIFLTGTRSAIFPLLIGLGLFGILNFNKNKKLFLFGITFAIILFSLSNNIINFLYAITNSSIFFWEDARSSQMNIHGSSFGSRIEKYMWVIDLLIHKSSLLFGCGFGYVKHFIATNGWVYPINGFEGFFLATLAESGIIGVLIWIVFFVSMFLQSISLLQSKHSLKILLPLYLAFFIFISATGFLDTLFYFILLSNNIILYYRYPSIKLA